MLQTLILTLLKSDEGVKVLEVDSDFFLFFESGEAKRHFGKLFAGYFQKSGS